MKRSGASIFFGLAVWLAVASPVRAQPIRVACLGDSITEGAGLGTNTYPATLGRLLGTNHQTFNFGVGGTTILRQGDYSYWNTAAFQTATNSAPDFVIIEFGGNDSKPQNWQYKSQFAGDLGDMIDLFANLPSHPRVLVCQ